MRRTVVPSVTASRAEIAHPTPASKPMPHNTTEDVMMRRRSFCQTLSPADRTTVAKWTRAVAAFYASIALVALIGIAVAHYRGEGAQSQIVTLATLQMN